MLYDYDCPHQPRCIHTTKCFRAGVNVRRSPIVPASFVFPNGGYQCARCACARVLGFADHLHKMVPTGPVYYGEHLDPTAFGSALRRARKLGVDRVAIRRYGANGILIAAEPVPTGNHPPLRRLTIIVAVALVSRHIRRAVNPVAEITVEFRGRERLVGVGQVQRIDWSEGWRPEPKARTTSDGIFSGIGAPEKVADLIRERTPYELGIPVLDPDLDAEVVAADIQEALSTNYGSVGWKASDKPPSTTYNPSQE